MVWTSRLNVEGGELFAELSLYCRGRCAGFPCPLLDRLGDCEPHGHKVSLWHVDRQHHCLPDSRILSYAAGPATWIRSGVAIFDSDRVRRRLQYVLYF